MFSDLGEVPSYFCSVAPSCPKFCDSMDYSKPGLPVPHHIPEFSQVHVHFTGSQVMPSSHLILWCPLLLLPLMFPNIRNFYKSACCQLFGHQMTKILELQFYISPSCEYSGLISLKINWFDLLAVQGTFRSLLQHHSSKASIIWHSAFSLVQLTQLYWLLGRQYPWRYGPLLKEWCLLFNTPSRFVIAFLRRSNHILISWLQFSSLHTRNI